MSRKVVEIAVIVCFSLMLGAGIVLNSINIAKRSSNPVSYWAVSENGRRKRVESIIVIPILEPNDVNGMWPVYYAETVVRVVGKRVKLNSKPFLFCDNPDLEGKHGDRLVYYILEEN